MNYFESFYASLYYSRKKNNMPAAETPLTANILMAVALFVFVASIIALLALTFPDLGDWITDLLKDTFGRSAGRTIGRLLAIVGIALFYPIVRFTVGTDAKYHAIINACDEMSEEEFKQVSNKGAIFMGVCLGIWVIPMIIGFLS